MRILQYPDPILMKGAEEVKKIGERELQYLDEMRVAMHREGGIGLAGPQVGLSIALIVIELTSEKSYDLINPRILEKKGVMKSDEGCLSIPGFRGTVKRARYIRVAYLDRGGEERIVETDGGLFSSCLQHEIDHLKGRLFIDLFPPPKRKILEMRLKDRDCSVVK